MGLVHLGHLVQQQPQSSPPLHFQFRPNAATSTLGSRPSTQAPAQKKNYFTNLINHSTPSADPKQPCPRCRVKTITNLRPHTQPTCLLICLHPAYTCRGALFSQHTGTQWLPHKSGSFYFFLGSVLPRGLVAVHHISILFFCHCCTPYTRIRDCAG